MIIPSIPPFLLHLPISLLPFFTPFVVNPSPFSPPLLSSPLYFPLPLPLPRPSSLIPLPLSPLLPPLHILTFSSGTFSLSGEIMAMMSLVTMGGAPGSEEGVVPNSSLPGRGEGRISRIIIEGSRHTTSSTQDHCEHLVESLDDSYISAEPMIQNQ